MTVRASDRDRAVILAGIAPGEKVITSPIRGVADGMKIEIVDKVEDAEIRAGG